MNLGKNGIWDVLFLFHLLNDTVSQFGYTDLYDITERTTSVTSQVTWIGTKCH